MSRRHLVASRLPTPQEALDAYHAQRGTSEAVIEVEREMAARALEGWSLDAILDGTSDTFEDGTVRADLDALMRLAEQHSERAQDAAVRFRDARRALEEARLQQAPAPRRVTLAVKARQALIEVLAIVQDGLCAYCRRVLAAVHIEHRTPLSRGGTNEGGNLCLACPTCNLRKGTRTAEEFLGDMG